MRRAIAIVFGLASVVTGARGQASACPIRCPEVVHFSDIEAPRNLEVLAQDMGASLELASDHEVRPLIPIRIDPRWRDGPTLWIPEAPLAANTTYTVLRHGRPFRSFRTGAEIDVTPPGAVHILDAQVTWRPHEDGYGWTDAGLVVLANPEVRSYEVTIEREGESFTQVIPAHRLGQLGDHCTPTHPAFSVEGPAPDTHCFEIRPRDLAGNTGPAARACATTRIEGSPREADAAPTLPPRHIAIAIAVAICLLLIRRRSRPVVAI
jgi:hypothetical protein